jgi:hypothetical protein
MFVGNFCRPGSGSGSRDLIKSGSSTGEHHHTLLTSPLYSPLNPCVRISAVSSPLRRPQPITTFLLAPLPPTATTSTTTTLLHPPPLTPPSPLIVLPGASPTCPQPRTSTPSTSSTSGGATPSVLPPHPLLPLRLSDRKTAAPVAARHLIRRRLRHPRGDAAACASAPQVRSAARALSSGRRRWGEGAASAAGVRSGAAEPAEPGCRARRTFTSRAEGSWKGNKSLVSASILLEPRFSAFHDQS